MAVNKVTMNTPEGEETLIDLTDDSVTPETLAEGETAHDASGAIIVGTAKKVNIVQELGDSETDVMSQAAIKKVMTGYTLGIHTNGLLYIFYNGQPIGTGISLPSGTDGDFLGNFDENGDVILSNQSLTNGDYVLYYRDEQGNLHEYANMTVVNTYAITWVVDGKTTTERVQEGAVPTFSGSTDKAADGQYTYTFKGWDKTVVAATEDVTYTAMYDKTTIEVEPTTYTIYWVVDGKTTTEIYEAGETPTFKGSTNKSTDDTYDYTFVGWSPAISAVTGNKTYTAQYNQSPKNWLKAVGYNTGKKVSTSKSTATEALNNTTSGACASNLIPYAPTNVTTDANGNVTCTFDFINISNIELSSSASINNVAFYDANGNRVAGLGGVAGGWPSAIQSKADANGNVSFTPLALVNHATAKNITSFLFSCKTIDGNSIVTFGEKA